MSEVVQYHVEENSYLKFLSSLICSFNTSHLAVLDSDDISANKIDKKLKDHCLYFSSRGRVCRQIVITCKCQMMNCNMKKFKEKKKDREGFWVLEGY